jgi:hypothetical protein
MTTVRRLSHASHYGDRKALIDAMWNLLEKHAFALLLPTPHWKNASGLVAVISAPSPEKKTVRKAVE